MPLTDAELAAHDPLARAFLHHLRAAVPTTAFEEIARSQSAEEYALVARVRAVSPVVGDVLVYSDATELTTFVGDHTHGHRGVYLIGKEDDPAAIDQTAAAEAEWIKDLLADRVVVWSRRGSGRQCLAGGTETIGSAAPLWRKLATEAWLWSGRAFPLVAQSDEST